MDRSEAVSYLKELLKNCNNMSPESVSFERKTDCDGYVVRIRGAIDESDKRVVRQIAKSKSLHVAEEKTEVRIYKPKV